MKQTISKTIAILGFLIIVCAQNPLYAVIRVSAQSGNFYDQNTWVGGFYPAFGDDIVISSGHTVTLNAAGACVRNITIEAGATLVNGAFDLTILTIAVQNPIYSNNGVHNGPGHLIAYEYYDTEVTGSGVTNCTIEIVSYGLRILGTCNLTINGNIQHSANVTQNMNGKYFIDNRGGSLTVNGDLITTPLWSVQIANWIGTLNINGNVFLYEGAIFESGSTIENTGTLNITSNLLLGYNYGYVWNRENGVINIGGDLLGGGAGVTYFIQDPYSTVKFGGSVFPASNDGDLCVAGPGAEPNIVEYNGGNNQVIKAPSDGATLGLGYTLNTYSNLVINNSSVSGTALNSDIAVNGTLSLTNGLVNLGSNNMTLGESSNISGTPSATNMIVANGTGELRKAFTSTGSFTFPVGDNDGTAEYSPVTLNFTSGTFTNAFTGVNLVNAAYSGSSGSYLERYWNITSSGITGFLCDAQFNYVLADIIGSENDIYCYRVAPTTDIFNIANTTLHQASASGLTSFGTFTGRHQPGSNKILNLSSIFLEGLYDGSGTMRRAMTDLGFIYPDPLIADQVTVELHDDANYSTVIYSASNVNLSTTGTATLTVPAIHNGSYYVTLKHRNSVETTTATAVSFAGSTISQSFGAPANVYGGNIGLMIDGHYVIYAGDVNQDGAIDSGDFTPVDNDASIYAAGYLATDINGDGAIDSGDFTSIDNNGLNYIGSSHP
jgi:hypothetical protein